MCIRDSSVIQKLDILFDDLSRAKFAMEEGGEREDRLGAMARAVSAVAQFINSFDEFRTAGLTAPLNAILSNIKDVAINGTLPEDFTIPAAKGVKDTERRKQLKLTCALAMVFYTETGMGNDDAAKRVVRMLSIVNLTAARVILYREEYSAPREETDKIYSEAYHSGVAANRARGEQKLSQLEIDNRLKRDSKIFNSVHLRKPRQV